ncbi:hypothetical protein T459_14762 [Capsicum annuum]|uniref:Phosphoribulokinase/uridine kinase domain-containing protein n=1 Tax=Capsicum annuum TaxID=4072 RepID=A0A1U8GXB9_CAPAN|nr:inorganic pyrophosphatase TTM2 isoform X2 [Capsicum annuum]PHT81747.1 hypothetical protein T459_14762 [Capsicum annuum]
MDIDTANAESINQRAGFLKDQVRLVKRKDCDRYEIASIPDNLSFEKGFFIVIRACQLLVQKNDGLIMIGVAGPSGAGKTVFTEKIMNFMPSIAVISMDNYNDASRIVDGNFDDPRLTDYDTLLKNINDLKTGKAAELPIYDFKSSSRIGYRTLEVPSSCIVIIEGIYALNEKLRPFLDLRISVNGGVHFDLVKRVLRDMQRAGQEPSEIIHQVSETEWVTDSPFVISPRISFEVSVRLLGGLMALGYTMAAILKRSSHVFSDERVCVKIDLLEQLKRHYVQVQGRDRVVVKSIADQLGLDGSYTPRTYIEQIQLEKLVNEVMALPDDLKTKLSLDEDIVASPKEAFSRASGERASWRNKKIRSGFSHSYSTNRDKNLSDVSSDYRSNGRIEESGARLSNQGAVTHLLEQISTLNDRMDDFTSKMEELNSKWSSRRASPRIKQASPSTQNLALETEACIGSAPTNYFISGLENGSLTGSIMPNSSSFTSVNGKEFTLMEEISNIARGQRQVMHQLDNVSNVLRERLGEESRQERMNKKRDTMDPIRVPLIVALAVGGLGILLFKSLQHQT